MINRIEYLIKHNYIIQRLYKITFSYLLKVWGKFIKVDNRLILFSSFGGKKFNDSPKVIYESMQKNNFFSDYKFIWAFVTPEKHEVSGSIKIRINSLKYFFYALKAKVWITSVNIERGLRFKKKNTIYINTWHGAGTKKIGNAVVGRNDYNFSDVDIMLVQSEFEKNIFSNDFKVKPSAFMKIGFPRSDILFQQNYALKKRIREELSIDSISKIVLYAPTWRESANRGKSYDLTIPLDVNKMIEILPNDCVVLFRTHAFTTSLRGIIFNEHIIDVSSYSDVNHLVLISDLIITDYSTIIYDAVSANKPFISYGYDYDDYKKKRGFYYNLDEVFPFGVIKSQNELLNILSHFEKLTFDDKFMNFKDKFIEVNGNATDKLLNEVQKRLESKL